MAGLVGCRAWAAPLTLFIDEDPVLIMLHPKDGLKGPLGAYVAKLIRQANVDVRLEKTSWSRALAASESTPNTCVVPTARTAERETRFAWLGPLYRIKFALFALPGAGPSVTSLDDVARQGLIVGTVLNEVSDSVIARYPNIRRAPVGTSAQNARKLAAGRIDLWASSEGSARDFAAAENLPPLRRVLDLMPLDVDLACHPDSDPAALERLSNTLLQLGPWEPPPR